MQYVGKLAVQVSAKTTAFQRSMKNAERSTKSFGGVASSARKAIIALGGAFAIGKVVSIGKDLARLAMIQEDAERKMSSSLRLLGVSSEYANERMKAFASSIQAVTIYGDEQILSIAALGASMGKLTGTDLENATKAAIGLSEAFGMQLEGAMRLVARAAAGDTAQLKRYGIIIDNAASKQEKFNQVLAIGIKNFALAEDRARSASGQLTQLGNIWGDVKEKLGQKIVNIGGEGGGIIGALKRIDDMLAEPSGVMPDIKPMASYADDLHELAKAYQDVTKQAELARGELEGIHQMMRVARDPARGGIPGVLTMPIYLGQERAAQNRLDVYTFQAQMLSDKMNALIMASKQGAEAVNEMLNRPAPAIEKAYKWVFDGIRNMEDVLRRDAPSRLEKAANSVRGIYEAFGGLIKRTIHWGRVVEAAQKKAAALRKAMQDKAQGIRDWIETPIERFRKAVIEIQELFKKGFLTSDEYYRAFAKARDELASSAQEPGGPSYTSRGIQEQARALQDRAYDRADKMEKLSRQQLAELELIRREIEKSKQPGYSAGLTMGA